MANNELSTTTASGSSQATTQTPQAAVQEQTNSAQAGSVQPGTSASLLNGQGGVPLRTTALSTVSLTNTVPIVTAPKGTPAKHHVNVVLFGFSGLFLLIAVILVWTTHSSTKRA